MKQNYRKTKNEGKNIEEKLNAAVRAYLIGEHGQFSQNRSENK